MSKSSRLLRKVKRAQKYGYFQYKVIAGDNCSSKCSLKAMDRRQRAGLFVKGEGYLTQNFGKGTNISLFVLSLFNPADQPYKHLQMGAVLKSDRPLRKF